MQGSGQRGSGCSAASLQRTLDLVECLDHTHVPKSGCPSVVVVDGRFEIVEEGLQPLVREVELHEEGSPNSLEIVPLFGNCSRLGKTHVGDRFMSRSTLPQ